MLGAVMLGNLLTIMAILGIRRLDRSDRDWWAYGMVLLPAFVLLITGLALSEAHRSPDGVSGSGQTAEP